MNFFVGSYGENSKKGIYTVDIDQSFKLSIKHHCLTQDNPSCILRKEDTLYVAFRNPFDKDPHYGGVGSFHIKNEEVIPTKTIRVNGDSYTHVCMNQDYIIAANYHTGTTISLKVENNQLKEVSDTFYHHGSGPDVLKRQLSSHIHYAGFTPDKKYVFVADLGGDEVVVFDFNKQTGKLTRNDEKTIKTKPGSGPRHLIFNHKGDCVYLVNELSNDINVYQYQNEQFTFIQNISCIPSDFSSFTATAAIRITKDDQYLFVSNRGHDSIAMYKIDNHQLTLLNYCPCLGKNPRDIQLINHDKHLLVANQSTNCISLFEIDYQNYQLKIIDEISIESPISIEV